MPEMIGTVVPRENGGLVVGLQNGIAFYDWESDTLERLPEPTPDQMQGRFNDGKCDPRGRFFVGSMSRKGKASLFRLDGDMSLRVVLSDIFTSNGLCWNESEGLMYYIDTGTRRIDVLDYDPDSGEICNRRPLYTSKEGEGRADGMTIDTEGRIWAAHYDGWGVHCIDPKSGKSLEKIDVPARYTTACWFGGETLEELYITTAIQQSSEEHLREFPETGSLFVCTPGAKGEKTVAFAG